VYIKRMKENSPAGDGLPALYALLGHACWNLKDYKAAAEAWDTAFSLNRNSGLDAANAANAYELTGRDDTALQRRLSAGKIFLQLGDFAELGALIPKILAAGEKNPEARLLAGQYAYATGDFDRAESELVLYEELRLAGRPVPKADHAAQRILGDLQSRRKKPAATPTEPPTPAPAPPVPKATPPEAVVAEGNLGSVEPRCRVPAKPAEKAVEKSAEPAAKKQVTKKTVAAKPATAAKKTPPVKKPAKAKTETKEKKPAKKTKAKPAAGTKAVPAKTKNGTTAKTAPAKAAKTAGTVKKGRGVKPAGSATGGKTKPAGTGKPVTKTSSSTAAKKTATAKAAKSGVKPKPAVKKPAKVSV
jgi:hypothetical protein